jgi:hypothetical protein
MAVMNLLTITNGDSASDLLIAAGKPGTILPWRDVLHEGPVVAGLGLREQSRLRAEYLARRLGLDVAEVESSFDERDGVVLGHEQFDRVEIWLEHDLYDQLQLLQVLDFFSGTGRSEGLILVQAGEFLGQQSANTILRFSSSAQTVNGEMLRLASTLWREFGADQPVAIGARASAPVEGFPFMQAALVRMLEELPETTTGLGRTETTALSFLAEKPAAGFDLFRRTIAAEEAPFMGDASFASILGDLAFCREPLIAGFNGPVSVAGEVYDQFRNELRLTRFGEDVIANNADHVAINGIDRWWGGTRLLGNDCWRYDREIGALVPPTGRVARAAGDLL